MYGGGCFLREECAFFRGVQYLPRVQDTKKKKIHFIQDLGVISNKQEFCGYRLQHTEENKKYILSKLYYTPCRFEIEDFVEIHLCELCVIVRSAYYVGCSH